MAIAWVTIIVNQLAWVAEKLGEGDAARPLGLGRRARRLSGLGSDPRRAIFGAIRRCRLVVGGNPTPRRRLDWHRNWPRRGPNPKPDSLLGNAAKYTVSGEVQLRLKVGESSRLRFNVEDSGSGIDAALQQHMIELFVLGARPDRPGGAGGVGLSLGIARDLVVAMAGSLQPDSATDRGSCFWFEIALPAVAPPPDTAAPVTGADSTSAAAPSIAASGAAASAAPLGKLLLIEGSEVHQIITQAVLEHGGWQVVVAGTGYRVPGVPAWPVCSASPTAISCSPTWACPTPTGLRWRVPSGRWRGGRAG